VLSEISVAYPVVQSRHFLMLYNNIRACESHTSSRECCLFMWPTSLLSFWLQGCTRNKEGKEEKASLVLIHRAFILFQKYTNYITHRHKTTHYNVTDEVPNSYITHHPLPSRANSIAINIVQCMISWNIKKCEDTVNSAVLTFCHFNYILYSQFYLYMFL
jgi:hypothetical protein